ncbi:MULTISPECIES: hypothetical protein [Deefgea]|uniref:Uncharacterized protein n=1 Tax=Deefgea chitinilytica TaxID=570276 RepID=A0ABS2CE70_9NEIS|nr:MULTISPECIES: hypothetical protein [Deefgea]MBM5572443.1 hypothetical protein [Deefgea chitinilytica]MBM9889679.1 hypothetical protein [Deefgea sp. CFH1-16]
MASKSTYWIGSRPSDGKGWTYTTSAIELICDEEREAIYRMYRRYVKQWNDIELNNDISLSEHTHEICGAKIVGSANRRFILHWQGNEQVHWILEVFFSRGFKQYYPGFSCALNTLRSTEDIRSIRLHWSLNGKEEFNSWLLKERAVNQDKEEWNEYKK